MEFRETVYNVHFSREGNLLAADLWIESLEGFLNKSPLQP